MDPATDLTVAVIDFPERSAEPEVIEEEAAAPPQLQPSTSSSEQTPQHQAPRGSLNLVAVIPSPTHVAAVHNNCKTRQGRNFKLKAKENKRAIRLGCGRRQDRYTCEEIALEELENRESRAGSRDGDGGQHSSSILERLSRRFRWTGQNVESQAADRGSQRGDKRPNGSRKVTTADLPVLEASLPADDRATSSQRSSLVRQDDQVKLPSSPKSLMQQEAVLEEASQGDFMEGGACGAEVVWEHYVTKAWEHHVTKVWEQEEEIVTAPEPQSPEPDNAFKFLPRGEEPELRPEFRERAKLALRNNPIFNRLKTGGKVEGQVEGGGGEAGGQEEEFEKAVCCPPCYEWYKRIKEMKDGTVKQVIAALPKSTKPANRTYTSSLTPQLKRASSMGFNMMKGVLFPAMPRFLQDLWVFLEFAVTLLSFVLAMVGLDLSENKALNIISLVLSIIGVILALIDGYIYFFQTSHLFQCFKTNCSKLFHRGRSNESPDETSKGEDQSHEEEQKDGDEESSTKRKWWQLSDNVKSILDTWFEVARTVISEVILYPQLVCDLLDFVSGIGELSNDLKEDESNRLDFSLFLVGNLYTIIAVYIMRLLIVVGTLMQIRRLPAQSSSSYLAVLARFLFHVATQIVLHAIIAITLAAKIHNENHGDQDGLRISPFLWVTIILGGILPLAGIAVFFLTNYYWMREFSISFWLDMISLLQAESFAEVVFQGETSNTAREKSVMLAEKTEFSLVKKQLGLYSNAPWLVKVTFPLRMPLLLLLAVLYDLCVAGFMASLALSTDSDTGEVTFVLFDTSFLSVMFFIILVCLLVANFQVLIIINLWLIVVVLIMISITIMVLVLSPILLVLYFPCALCGTCVHTLLPKFF